MSTTVSTHRRPVTKVFNFPNIVTGMRLILSVVLFVLLMEEHYLSSLAVFIVAASTDWLDGYYARRFGQVTTLGRILDPFADKVIVCGTYIILAAIPAMLAEPWGLRAWMVVVIVGRELLITALRSFLEERGADFSAKMAGKVKMVLQCIAAGACIVLLHYPAKDGSLRPDAPWWVWWTMVVTIWSTIALTVYSGVMYVVSAVRILQREQEGSLGP